MAKTKTAPARRIQVQIEGGPCTLARARTVAEKAALGAALETADGNRELAAKILEISESRLYEMLKAHTDLANRYPGSPRGQATRKSAA
ncbi:MAG: hypothetical protein IPJ61_19975 [Tessaracoccus sp.]|nr:hypothetical protein [Tessaracoccus sp.]